MGIYGYDKDTTPNIDRWAKEAQVFTNAYTVVPATYPSFAELMTGKSPFESKIFNNSISYEGLPSDLVPIGSDTSTIAEILKKKGFMTAAFINTPSLSPELTYIDKGFDLYKNYSELPTNGPSQAEQYKSYTNMNDALNWLDKNKNQKLFLWLHLMEPHAPYLPIDQFRCIFNDTYCEEISKRGLDDLEEERNKLKMCQKKEVPKEKIELFETLYDGAIRSTDFLIAKIFDRIKALGLDKKTIVVLYGDHGEGFDHNYFFMHAHELYNSHIKIPFIVKVPGKKGITMRLPLQNTDMFSLILDLFSIRSPVVRSSFLRNPFVNESRMKYFYYINTDLSKFAVQQGKYKYIYSIPGFSCLFYNQTEELYNIEKDPGEIRNIIGEEAMVAKKLKTNLLIYLKKHKIPTTPQDKKKLIQKNEEKKNALEKLKSLGY